MPVSILRTRHESIWKNEPQLIVAEADYGFGHTVDIPLPQHYFDDDFPRYAEIAAEGLESLARALLAHAEALRKSTPNGHQGSDTT